MKNFKPSKGIGKYMFGRVTGRQDPNSLDYGFILTAALALVAVLALWWTPVLFPFRIFTTIIHEGSHAAVAIITGGSVKEIKLDWRGAGVTYIYGGFDLLVYSAGYVGSTLFGGFLLLMAKRPDTRRNVLYYITGALLLLTAFFVRDIGSLLLIAIVAGLTGLVAYKGPDLVVTFYLFVMAILNVTYALFDLLGLVMASSNPFESLNGRNLNDASMLADRTGVPAIVWAVLWSIVSLWMLWQFVRVAIRVGRGNVAQTRKRPSLLPGFGSKNKVPKDSAQSIFEKYL
jgi:hypothetical protein